MTPFLQSLLAMVLLAISGVSVAQSNPDLEKVLTQMDTAAKNFRTTEASFVWDEYQKVVDESDTQKGNVYFRRTGDEVEMAADISDPDKKYVLFTDSKIQVYQPKIDQVTVYNTGKDKAAFESYLVLGFGGRGHDMLQSFDVKSQGTEKVDGIDAAKLDLVPKNPKVKNVFSHIILWIDPARGVSVQQQLFEPSGDYRLAKYSNIQINQKLPDSVFKLKTSGKTKFLSPQG
jgi:outer membrane lipoprotein-sorting protein